MPSHPDRVRRNYDCWLCGTNLLVGEHAVYEPSADGKSIVICRPMLLVMNPAHIGTISSLPHAASE